MVTVYGFERTAIQSLKINHTIWRADGNLSVLGPIKLHGDEARFSEVFEKWRNVIYHRKLWQLTIGADFLMKLKEGSRRGGDRRAAAGDARRWGVGSVLEAYSCLRGVVHHH
jgi:hypothetical protein